MKPRQTHVYQRDAAIANLLDNGGREAEYLKDALILTRRPLRVYSRRCFEVVSSSRMGFGNIGGRRCRVHPESLEIASPVVDRFL